MTTIPAVVAGVPEIAVLTPPTPDGDIDAATLVAARMAGVEEVYKCGGAQSRSRPSPSAPRPSRRCVKIVGPGSPYVVAAKRLLGGSSSIPAFPPGPAKSIVLSDETANGRLAALDLLVESEHGPDSSAFLVTRQPRGGRGGARRDPGLLAADGRAAGGLHQGGALRPAWRHRARRRHRPGDRVRQRLRARASGSHEQGAAAVSRPPPARRRDPAGRAFRRSPSATIVLGPNCVLPTCGQARTWSPLSVFDFMKRTSIGYVTARRLSRRSRPMPARSRPTKASTATPTRSRRCGTMAS